MLTGVEISCFRSLDLSLITKELKQSVTILYFLFETIIGCVTDGLNNELLVWYSGHGLNNELLPCI